MRPLNGHDILRVWERGQAESPLRKALALAELAAPELGTDRLVELPVGRRDALILDLREATFGGELGGYAECPRCGERLEVAFSAAALRGGADTDGSDGAVEIQGYRVRLRPPTSGDLLAVGGLPDAQAAARALARRCVLDASRGEQVAAPADLPDEVLERLESALAEADPRAEVLLDLTCPACEHAWQALFDVAEFFWTELAAQAKRTLLEVHTLARAYGWREADILSMSSRRRQAYLELVS
jgi:hypothetical protein